MSSDMNAVQRGCISSNPSLSRDRISIQVVEFLLGNDPFAIDLFEVKEVMDDSAIIGIIKRSVGIPENGRNELIIWIDINQLLQGIS